MLDVGPDRLSCRCPVWMVMGGREWLWWTCPLSSSASVPCWPSRGQPKIVVAAQFGVSRQTLHTWLSRYAREGLAGLMDRTHRPDSCPHQADAEVETRVCELRREHPWWGGPGGSLMSWPAPLPRAACRRGS